MHIDMNGALSMAQAMGVEPLVASALLAACAKGLASGAAEKRAKTAEEVVTAE